MVTKHVSGSMSGLQSSGHAAERIVCQRGPTPLAAFRLENLSEKHGDLTEATQDLHPSGHGLRTPEDDERTHTTRPGRHAPSSHRGAGETRALA